MRKFKHNRETGETKITVEIDLDVYSKPEISTPVMFLNHMLEVFAYHSGFSLKICAESIDKDPHHLIEDVAITIGKALSGILNDNKSINRYGWSAIPMDEALVLSSVDIGGRANATIKLNLKDEMINDLPAGLITHFFTSLASTSLMNIHIQQLNGTDDHHIVEAGFKSFAHSLAMAVQKSDKYANRSISSKGVV